MGRVGEDLNLVLVVIAFFFGLDRERDLELELDDNPLYDVLDLVGVRDRERSTGPAIKDLFFLWLVLCDFIGFPPPHVTHTALSPNKSYHTIHGIFR